MLLRQQWIHDIKAVPSFLHQKVQFLHEGAIVTIYGDTLSPPKPIFGIQSEKEPVSFDGFKIEKTGFEKVTKEVEKIPTDFDPHSNNNVVAMMSCVYKHQSFALCCQQAACTILGLIF